MNAPTNDSFVMTPGYYAKRLFWLIATPVFPVFQWFLQRPFILLGLVTHDGGRQDFYLGKVRPDKTIKELIAYLANEHGFGNHFIALHDEGQLVSLRRLHNFKYQYHIRIFKDGEVRGHYELTPESHPFKHLKGEDFHHRPEEFSVWLKDWVV